MMGGMTTDPQQRARDRLTEKTRRYREAEAAMAEARKDVTEEIVDILKARTLGPSEVTRLSPFERQHIVRLSKAAGIPPLRKGTVVSAKRAAGQADDE